MSTSEASSLDARVVRRCGWALLITLLTVTVIGACVYDRVDWPGQLAGETTYLMQARSLAADLDLVYTRADYDRTLLGDLEQPTDLALVSVNGGRQITFDRPFPYALYLAPFVKIWPRQGFALANALLLALVSCFAARTLERQIGPWGAVWVVLLVFASVLFAYVFLATGDLFLFAVTLLAFCCIARASALDGETPAGGVRSRGWWLAGALLAIPAATEPLYLVLLAAAFFAPAAQRRGIARTALVIGFVASLTIQLVVGWWGGGGPVILGAESFRFTPETGFPLVDFTAAEWSPTVRRLSALYWDEAPRFAWGVDARLWLWDALYLVLGESIGVLPYFAPLVLVTLTGSLAGHRRPLALAALAWGLGVVVVHPFNVYGGEGAIGNRLFLPIYGALWLLADSAGWRRRWLPVVPVAALALAAPFLGRLWSSPWEYPIDSAAGYRHVTSTAHELLPYETSQRWLPGGRMAEHNGLMVKFLTDRGWAETRRNRLMVDGSGAVEVLISSMQSLDALRLDFGKDAPSQIEIQGGTLAEKVLQPGGGISFRVEPRSSLRRHPMWWTPEPQWLYRLGFNLPPAPGRTLAFELYGERFAEP